MVGEIRDLETAEIAIKAAQTGHLVMSTLHTNDAPQTLTRLVDMGVKPYAIATSVSLIIAQRLARRLCSQCKAIVDIPPKRCSRKASPEADVRAGIKIYGPKGCSNCTDGYKGRCGIYQVMPVTESWAASSWRRQRHRHQRPGPPRKACGTCAARASRRSRRASPASKKSTASRSNS
jgi:type IV pilus assembly protein PilB